MRWIISLVLLTTVGCSSFSGQSKERANLHTQIATGYYEQQNYPMALKEYLEAEKLDPENPQIENDIGLTYYQRERYDLAEKYIRHALTIEPKYTDARNDLARIYIERGRYKDAETELKIVLNDFTYTGVARGWFNLGLSRFDQKDWKGARDAFEKSLKLDREDCFANSYYGRTFFEEANYNRAAEILDHAITFCQKLGFDEPHYYSALAWYRAEDKDRSIARFEEVMKLYPNGKYREKARSMLDLIRKGETE